MTNTDELIAGRYRLLRRIGTGGMGVVWLAHDELLGRDVAVKQLHPERVAEGDEAARGAQRAMREARITARLHHPHAVTVHDVVEHEGRPCLVMQYFPSVSLAELSAGEEPLGVAAVAAIGGEVASALAAAHEEGIVHRDVKPANILVAPDGTAKISDFGIAHALDDVSLTTTGLVTGTPAFLAPEVARGDPSTPSSDVFSLGSTLYTVLEGRPPFGTDENPMAVLHRVASGEVEPLVRSGELTELLVSMLALDPADRPPMSEVAATLSSRARPGATTPADTAITATLPEVAAEPDDAPQVAADPDDSPEEVDLLAAFRADRPTPTPGTGPAGRRSGRRRGVLVLLLLAVVAGLVGVVLAQRSDDRDAAGPSGSTSARSSGSSATPSPSPTGTPSPSTSPTTSPSASASATPSPSASSTPSPSPSDTPSPSASSGTPTAAELSDALTGYYALLPGNRDAGWKRLTARYQRTTATNRDTYDRFWDAIDRVRTADVQATAPSSVTATVTYDYADGRTYVERTAYRLVRDDGLLKIDRSEVLSSAQR